MKDQAIALLRRAILRHTPARHGLMLPPNPRAKYHEIATAPTDDQLRQHLAGLITLAAPATGNDLAGCIIFDIDGEASDTIPALLDTARQRGLWAWGEWHVATDRGYVWVPFDRLTSAAALATLGQELVATTDLTTEQRKTIDNRTAKKAITRLPFGRHTRTGQRGDLIFQDGTSTALDADADAALALWMERYQENPADQVTPITAAPAQAHLRRQASSSVSAAEVQHRWNAAHDVCDILQADGGRRSSRTSWHCPCGQHRNGDRTPSLLIRPAKNERYGSHIVQGYSPTCAFHGTTDVFDAFNVYRILHGLSNAEMLLHARRELGLLERAPAPQPNITTSPDHHARRRSVQPAETAAETPAATPAQPTVSAAAVLARAGKDCSLSRAMRSVLASVVALIDTRPATQITLRTLVDTTGLTRRTIQIAQRRLVEDGYLTITPTSKRCGGDDANRYALCMGGRSKRSPLKIKAWKGGQSLPSVAESPPPAAALEPVPTLPAAAAAPEPVDGVETRFPQKVTLENICATVTSTQATHDLPAEDGPGATFDPVGYAAWAATLDPTTERPWTYSRSPREVMQGHEYGMAELLRGQAERQSLASSAAPSAEPPAPRLSQSLLTLPAPVPAATAAPVAGIQALRAELQRIEREARRYFAQKAVNAGKQAQIRAAAVRRALVALEGTLSDRPAGAAKKTPGRGRPTPPSMPPLGTGSGDFGTVAVGDIHTGVAELERQGAAGSGLGQAIGGDGAAEKLLGVGGAKGVHAEARACANPGGISRSGDLALGNAGEVAGIGEDVVAVTRHVVEDSGIEQAGDEALATALGVAADNLDCFIFKIDVLNPQPRQLVDAETAAESQPCGQLDFAREVGHDRGGVRLGEAEAGHGAGNAGADLGNESSLVTPPAALAHPGLQLVQACDSGADTAAGELALLAVADVGNPVVVGDDAQLTELASVAVVPDPADGGDGAGLVGLERAIAKNHLASGALQLGLVAAGAGLENTVKGVGHRADYARPSHRRRRGKRSAPTTGFRHQQASIARTRGVAARSH